MKSSSQKEFTPCTSATQTPKTGNSLVPDQLRDDQFILPMEAAQKLNKMSFFIENIAQATRFSTLEIEGL